MLLCVSYAVLHVSIPFWSRYARIFIYCCCCFFKFVFCFNQWPYGFWNVSLRHIMMIKIANKNYRRHEIICFAIFRLYTDTRNERKHARCTKLPLTKRIASTIETFPNYISPLNCWRFWNWACEVFTKTNQFSFLAKNINFQTVTSKFILSTSYFFWGLSSFSPRWTFNQIQSHNRVLINVIIMYTFSWY